MDDEESIESEINEDEVNLGQDNMFCSPYFLGKFLTATILIEKYKDLRLQIIR